MCHMNCGGPLTPDRWSGKAFSFAIYRGYENGNSVFQGWMRSKTSLTWEVLYKIGVPLDLPNDWPEARVDRSKIPWTETSFL
jgi:hypothetical protein